jgi:hypothetical protein
MEREPILTPEEKISRILGLPPARIAFMKEEYDMPVTYPEFSEWFVENPEIILKELQENFEASLFPRELRPETPEPTS